MKRWLSMVLMVCMLLAVVPMQALAADGENVAADLEVEETIMAASASETEQGAQLVSESDAAQDTQAQEAPAVGYVLLMHENNASKLYAYTDEDVLIGEYTPGADYTGIFVCKNATTYLKNGVPCAAGLVKDGEDYYYINSSCEAVTSNYDVTRPNGLLMPGFYRFGSDGKMINPPVYADGPNNNGFFYLGGVKQTGYQLIRFEDHYYFISDYDKYARNITLLLSDKYVAGTGLTPGNYYFDGNGVMWVKDGPDADGFFYLDGKKITGYQLIRYQNDYYFISDGNLYARDITLYLNADFLTGTDLKPGSYSFDSEGKMILADGPGSDGYFYLNTERQKCYQLIRFEGGYYFINDGHKYARNCTIYLSDKFLGGTGLKAGYYDFGADGRMDIKNGPNADGFFYRDGVRQNCYQLVEYEGSYYFINDGHKYARNCTIYLSAKFLSGTGLKAGYYDFGADGRLNIKNGPNADGFFYRDGVRQSCYQLVEFEGSYYFINDGHKYARNCTIYLSDKFLGGTGLKAGYYDFGADGRLNIKNGPNADGFFYRNGVRQNCYQLVEYEGDHYFINDGHKYAKNCTIYLSQKFVDGTVFAPGYYAFDAEGRMITKNGPDANGYFYLDGVKQKGIQLIKFDGTYYYVYTGDKIVKNRFLDISGKYVAGTDLRHWYYGFDEEGRMIGYYEGIPNGRDIGEIEALKTMDGKDIRSGLLIRGCELDNANYYFPEDIIEIGIDRLKNEFHVKYDMDLRAPSVVGKDLLGSGVIHKTYNMVLYDQVFTANGKAKIKEVFTDLADPDNYPMYLHCTHGIDRTGTVCFILEMALGVPYDALWTEYMYSVGAHDGSILKVWNGIMDNYAGSDSREKAIAFLKDCGVTQEQIDSLYQIYLTD